MILPFHAAARMEAESAAKWYAAQREFAMTSCVAELRLALERINTTPQNESHFMHGARYRKRKRSPNLIEFCASEGFIEIVAVAHTRRKPGYWKSHLVN